MVPVSWALASADVNAGTARAARIAIIAITTSSSISVNAVNGLVNLIFIFGFFSCSCSQGFCLRMGFIAGVTDNVNNYFYFFQAATRIAQSFARYGGIEAANLMGFT